MNEIKKINIPVVLSSLLAMVSVVLYIILDPEGSVKNVLSVRDFITQNFGFAFLVTALYALGYLLWLATSKYGNIRFGEGNPEYSFPAWLSMIFCAGASSSVLFWGTCEWAYYYQLTPLGAEAMSPLAAELATPYAFFHWGFGAWAMYMIGVIAMAHAYFNRKMKNGLTMSAMCSGCIGEERAKGLPGKFLDWLLIFGLLGGFIPTVALAVPFIANGFCKVMGIEETFAIRVMFCLVIAVGFTTTSYLGIEKGMKRLANVNAKLAIAIVFFIFITGPIIFILNNTVNAFGIMLSEFIRMSTWTDPIVGSGFPEAWTMFYYAWFLATATLVWIFGAKLSKGRTVRQVTFGLLLGGPMGTWFIFSVLTGNAINKQISGAFDFVALLNNTSAANAINTLVQDYTPLGDAVLVVWVLVCVIFVMSSMDGCTFALGASSTKDLDSSQEPSKTNRLFWSLILTVVPLGLFFIDAPLQVILAFTVITGLPLLAVIYMITVSITKWFKEDCGELTADQIKVKYAVKVERK